MKTHTSFSLFVVALALSFLITPMTYYLHAAEDEAKTIVFIAGTRSHGYGAHEFNAGSLLMQKLLGESMPELKTRVYLNGWPKDPDAFDGADTVVIFCNGGGGHVVIPHLESFDKVMKKGVGLVNLHYAVEVPKGDPGRYMLEWMGGYFEPFWSVNPHWTANFTLLPEHEIANGVDPFKINDEWYFHMRFRENMRNVIPILSAHPPEKTMDRPDGAHSGNPHVRQAMKNGEIQHVAWAYERPEGGRGFGFTGAHYHWNWEDDQFRKIVMNAIVWTAGLKVPENGVETRTPSREELEENQDYEKP